MMTYICKLTSGSPAEVLSAAGATARALKVLQDSSTSATCHVNHSQQLHVAESGVVHWRTGAKRGRILFRFFFFFLAQDCYKKRKARFAGRAIVGTQNVAHDQNQPCWLICIRQEALQTGIREPIATPPPLP